MKKIPLFAVVAAGALMLATSVLAGPGGADRPFKGTGSGATTVDLLSGPPVYDSDSAGKFRATHLGKGTYTIDATQDWTSASWPANPCAVVDGSFVFTAANGATLTADVAGETCEVTPFDDTSYSTDLDLTITGGTGRFTGATGTIKIMGTSLATGLGTFGDSWSAVGKISY